MATPHIAGNPGDFAETVLMPGDPLRAKFIAETYFENPVLINNIRGVQGYTGTWRGAGDGTSDRNREGAAVSVYGAGCHEPFRAVAYGQHRIFGQRTGRVGSQSEVYVPDGSGRTGAECHDHAERCG